VPSLTPEGLVVERAAEIQASILDDLESFDGVGTIDRTRLDQRVDGQFSALMAERLDDLGQALVAVRDARSRNNATARQLDDIGEITGTFRDPATYSTCPIEVAGVAGTIILAGKIVEHSTTKTRWIVVDPITIDSLGAGAGTVQADTAGPVLAGIGDLTSIVTGVTGWTSVTNATAATAGRNRETDAAYRLRQLVELPGPGAGTTNALRAALLKLEAVTAAVVISNTKITAATVQGVALPGASLAAYVWPATLGADDQALVAEVMWAKGPAGIEQRGSVTATVTDIAGGTQPVAWEWATEVPLTAAVVTVVLKTGFALVDVQEAIELVIIGTDDAPGYFPSLTVGQVVSAYDLGCLIHESVPGLRSISFSWDDGTGPVTGDYTPAVIEIVTLDLANLTVTL